MRRRDPVRPRPNDARNRRFAPVNRSNGTLPVWVWGVGVAVLVVLVGAAIFLLTQNVRSGSDNPSPNGATGQTKTETAIPTAPAQNATTTVVGATPGPTNVPITVAPPTEPPRFCVVLTQVWVRSEPTDDSIGLAQLDRGASLTIIGSIEQAGKRWYRVGNYPPQAFVPVDAVQC